MRFLGQLFLLKPEGFNEKMEIYLGTPGTFFFCKYEITKYVYIYIYDTDTNDHQCTFHFYVHGFRTKQRPQGLEAFIFGSTLPRGYLHVLSGKIRGWKTILSLVKWPLFRKKNSKNVTCWGCKV